MLATSLEISAFKAFETVPTEVPLSPLTVIVGANGTGKTTVLQAFALFGRLTRGTLSEMLESTGWEYSDLPHLRAPRQRFAVTARLAESADEHPSLEWHLGLHTRKRPGIHEEAVTLLDGEYKVMERSGRQMTRVNDITLEDESIKQTLTSSWVSAVDPQLDEKTYPELVQLHRWATGGRFYLLDAWRMRRASRRSTVIGEDGRHLAGFLRTLRDTRPTAMKRVRDRVRRHYPRLDTIRLVQKKAGWTEIEVQERWGDRSIQFNARQVSDGLLRLLAISAMFELDPAPTVILLDEIENGLHPHLLRGVIDMLQELVDERAGETQVLCTTHSPIALNYVRDASQILVTYRDRKTAVARIERLDRMPRYDALSEYFDKGDLWYNVGEEALAKTGKKRRRG